MGKPQIAFFSFPYAAGVIPTLSCVETLVRRGYRVTYVTSDKFAKRVLELGAEFLPCPQFDPRLMHEGDEHLFARMAVGTLENVADFYRSNRPSLVVYDWIACAGRIVSENWGIPAVQTSPAFAFDSNILDLHSQSSAYCKGVLYDAEAVNRFLLRYGIEGNFPFHKELLNIYFYPKEFQLDASHLDHNCFYAGRCAAEQPYHRKWRRHESDGRPTVLVTTSTVYVQGDKFFKMCVEALAELRWHVILALGDTNDPASLCPLPPHFEIIQNMPQIQVLPHTDLLICLGGMIISVEAMYHGVPTLMITHGHSEAELYAEKFSELGIGKHLKLTDTTAENIRKSLLELSLDRGIRTRVSQMQQVVQRSPGAEEVANQIAARIDSVS